MKKTVSLLLYGLLFVTVIFVDRITKMWALVNVAGEYHINQCVAIVSITFLLISFAYHRWCDARLIVGELLIIAGSASNIIDRFFYRGVIDFILLSCKGWSFPVFNLADVAIVLGVILMFIGVYHDSAS